MPTLAFDTSTSTGVVALLRPDGSVVQRVGPSESRHGETLIPMIQQVVAEAGVGIPELRLVAVGTGPGSFTGLRVGLSTAKGLGLARDLAVVGVSSLEALATRAMAEVGFAPTAAVVDAYRGEVYVALYRMRGSATGGTVAESLPPFSAAPEAAARQLRSAVEAGSVTLVGNGVRKYVEEFRAVLGDSMELVAESLDTVCPVTLGRIGQAQIARLPLGQATSLADVQPVYVRGADARLPDVPLKL